MEKVEIKSEFPNIGNILWEQVEKQNGVDFVFQFANDTNDEMLDEIGVHSVVLTSQSKVFDAMINGKLKEKSPLILKDAKPGIFKKFISMIYGLPTNVFSAEEARDLYYLGSKYDYPIAITIAKKYLISNIDYTNSSYVHECSLLFDDQELSQANWNYLEKSIVQTIKGLECIEGSPTLAMEDFSFEVKHSASSSQVLNGLREVLKEIRIQQDVKVKISNAIALIQSLIEESEKYFRLVVPNEAVTLVTRLEHNKVKSDFHRLNKLFKENVKCNLCANAAHNLVECVNYGLATIFNKYKHDDLYGYSMADINTLYNCLKAYLPSK